MANDIVVDYLGKVLAVSQAGTILVLRFNEFLIHK